MVGVDDQVRVKLLVTAFGIPFFVHEDIRKIHSQDTSAHSVKSDDVSCDFCASSAEV